jgi:MFS transporter, DHA1 family, multidrug resistance protein
MDTRAQAFPKSGRIFIFGFLSAIAPLSIDIYLPALPMLRQALAADEAQTLFTLSAFFIGFGGGQLLFGPLSDRFGRRPILIVGLIVYVAASIACASAASMSAVIFWRFIQALGGSVVPTAVQAMVRDLYDRNQSARVLSLNMVVTASAPVMAPLIGGQLLLWFDWRGIFWVLVIFGVISLCAAFRLPETLAPSRRSEAHPVAMLLGYFQFLRSIRYVGYVACSAFYFCCLFAFIAGSPFVYIDYFGVPPQYYGFLFGVNMLGMIATTFVNSRIVVRRGSDHLLRIACVIGALSGFALLFTGFAQVGGIIGLAIPLFVVLSLLTMVASNAISGALSVFPHRAGAAASLAGAIQFGSGALASAAVGWSANGTPRPLIAIICGCATAALLVNLFLLRNAPKPVDAA